MFKIIAKGKVSEHLKESAVAGSFSDIFNITGTDAFLAGCPLFFWEESPAPVK